MKYHITFQDFFVDASSEDDAYDLAIGFLDDSPTDFLVVKSVEAIDDTSP